VADLQWGQGRDRRPQLAQRSGRERARIVAQRTLDAFQNRNLTALDGEALIPSRRASRAIPGLGAPKEGAIFEAQSAGQSSGTLAHLSGRKCSGLHIVSQAGLCRPLLHSHTGMTTTRATGDAANESHRPPFFVSRPPLHVGQGMFDFSWRET
jgi:hypothetical protein